MVVAWHYEERKGGVKIAVIGAGAIGSLIAGYLADKGEQVILIAHPEQLSAISANGLIIEGVRGKLLVKLSVKSQLQEQADLVILATKTQDLEKTIVEYFNYLRDPCILAVQNGVRAEEIIAQQLGTDNLFTSIVMFGATCLAPGKIIHNFEGNWILGRKEAGPQEPLEKINQFTGKIFPTTISENIMPMKWLKLFVNANNCLPAILGKSMQQTFQNIDICKISLGIWQEAWSLVHQAKVKLASLPDFPIERVYGLLSMPRDEAVKMFSQIMVNLSKEPVYGSILQSIKRERPSEIDYINGEFVQLADIIGQTAALNKKLVEMVHQVEQTKQFFSEQELIAQTQQFIN